MGGAVVVFEFIDFIFIVVAITIPNPNIYTYISDIFICAYITLH